MTIGRTWLLASGLLVGMTCTLEASAYNNREHQRLPDHAYRMMNILRRGDYLTRQVNQTHSTSYPPLWTRPASVDPAEQATWDRFIQEMREAPDKLGELLVGLPDPHNASRCPTVIGFRSHAAGRAAATKEDPPPRIATMLAETRGR